MAFIVGLAKTALRRRRLKPNSRAMSAYWMASAASGSGHHFHRLTTVVFDLGEQGVFLGGCWL
jgi:hypothetical protein